MGLAVVLPLLGCFVAAALAVAMGVHGLALSRHAHWRLADHRHRHHRRLSSAAHASLVRHLSLGQALLDGRRCPVGRRVAARLVRRASPAPRAERSAGRSAFAPPARRQASWNIAPRAVVRPHRLAVHRLLDARPSCSAMCPISWPIRRWSPSIDSITCGCIVSLALPTADRRPRRPGPGKGRCSASSGAASCGSS